MKDKTYYYTKRLLKRVIEGIERQKHLNTIKPKEHTILAIVEALKQKTKREEASYYQGYIHALRQVIENQNDKT